ncbi:hypothetical protein RUND412_003296 [Rhizina undulata]
MPAIHNSPSAPNLNFHPLGIPRSNSSPRPQYRRNVGIPSKEEELTPRPLRVRKLRKSPSVPSSIIRSRLPSKLEIVETQRTFFGINLPPAPKPRSSSTGVLSTKQANPGSLTQMPMKERRMTAGKPRGFRSASPKPLKSNARKKAVTPGAGMGWLQRPQTAKPPHVPVLITPQLNSSRDDKSSAPSTASRNTSAKATTGGSSRNSSMNSVETHQHISLSSDVRKGPPSKRSTSCDEAYGNVVKEKSNVLSSEPDLKLPDETSNNKAHTKGWKKKMFTRDFFMGGASSRKYEKVNSKGKGDDGSFTTETESISSRSFFKKEAAAPANFSSSSNASQRSCSVFADSAWQLDGHDGSALDEYLQGGAKKVFNDSVIGIFNGKIGGLPRRSDRPWNPPVLTLEVSVVAEIDKFAVNVMKSEGYIAETWVVVELQAKVESEGTPIKGVEVGLDVGILMDISTYTSPAGFLNMKAYARKLVEAMETSRDRVAVMTFSAPLQGKRRPRGRGQTTLNVLNSSGSVSRRQLIENIAALTLDDSSIDPSGRDVAGSVLAAVHKLKMMPLDTSKYGAQRHAHLFLFTSKLEDGDIHLLPEVLFGDVQVHVIGLGPIFWPKSNMGGSGWCIATSLLPLESPKSKIPGVSGRRTTDVASAQDASSMDTLIKLMRLGIHLGELRDVHINLDVGEGCFLKAIIGDTVFARLLPGERRNILARIEVGDLPGFNFGFDYSEEENFNKCVMLERQLEATLGELKSCLLRTNVSYSHSHFPETTRLSTEKAVYISRFLEDSVWGVSGRRVSMDRKPSSSNEEYVRKALMHMMASTHENPRQALKAVEEVVKASMFRGLDFIDVSKELKYRIGLSDMFGRRTSEEILREEENYYRLPGDLPGARRSLERRASDRRNSMTFENLSQTSRDSTDLLVSTSVIAITRPSFDAAQPPYYAILGESMPKTPINGISRIESSSESSLTNEQTPDEAKLIWRELKKMQKGEDTEGDTGSIRKKIRTSRSSHWEQSPRDSIGTDVSGALGSDGMVAVKMWGEMRCSMSDVDEEDGPEVGRLENSRRKRSGSTGEETLQSLITLRDVRETDFSPWAL